MYEILAIDPSLIEPIKAFWQYAIPAAVSLFSANSSRKAAKSQANKDRQFQQEQAALLEKQKQAYRDMVFTNPFADMTNAYSDLQTDFSNLASGAKNVYAGAEDVFANIDNTYEGMENRFEDMTVDMRAADFQRQQGQQQRANILGSLRGAAGSSGVASLAQTLANQGALQSQQIAAGIGQQERQNQMLAAREGSRIDQLQRATGLQLQQLQAQGALKEMAGASEQQRLQLAGAQQARGLGVARENMIAQGEQQADMARRTGDQMLQEAEMSRQATLLGMQYGQSSGANQQLQMSLYNQQQANNAASQMTTNALSSIPFGDIDFGGGGGGSSSFGLGQGLGGNTNFSLYQNKIPGSNFNIDTKFLNTPPTPFNPK
jgi:alpha-ketoglutarate-dependent taurine dioxygenase